VSSSTKRLNLIFRRQRGSHGSTWEVPDNNIEQVGRDSKGRQRYAIAAETDGGNGGSPFLGPPQSSLPEVASRSRSPGSDRCGGPLVPMVYVDDAKFERLRWEECLWLDGKSRAGRGVYIESETHWRLAPTRRCDGAGVRGAVLWAAAAALRSAGGTERAPQPQRGVSD